MTGAKKRNAAWATGLTLSAVLLVGCTPASQPMTDVRASYEEKDTLSAFNGLSYDYDPLNTPDELAKLSELIISGTVAGVQQGRTTVFPENPQMKGSTTIVLAVSNATAVRGEMLPDSDGTIYIELANPGQKDPISYREAFPVGGSVVAYMVAASDGAWSKGTDVALEDSEAGRAEGQALYLPANPQSLILQVGEKDVVWPLIGTHRSGSITDTLPGGNLIAE